MLCKACFCDNRTNFPSSSSLTQTRTLGEKQDRRVKKNKELSVIRPLFISSSSFAPYIVYFSTAAKPTKIAIRHANLIDIFGTD